MIVAVDRAAALKNAEKLLRQGKLDQAIAEYTRVVDDQPADWTTRNMLGDLCVRAGQVERARAEYTQIADAFYRDGFLQKAGALYRKVLKLTPDDEHAALQAAEVSAAQGLLRDARAGFAAVMDRRRSRGDAAGVLALVVRMGALDPADVAARIAAARAKAELGDVEASKQALKMLAGELTASADERAAAVLEELVRLAPDEAVVVEATIAPPPAPALPADDGLVEALPDAMAPVPDIAPEPVHVPLPAPVSVPAPSPLPVPAPSAPPSIVPAQTRAENVEVDLSVALESMDKPPDVSSQAPSLDDVFAQMRDEARRRIAIETAEQDYRKGVTLFQGGRIDESIDVLQSSARTPRFRFEAGSLLGRIFLSRGDLARAIEWLERAAEAPAPSPDDLHKVLYNLADALESAGDIPRALAVAMQLQASAGRFLDVAVRVKRLAAAQERG